MTGVSQAKRGHTLQISRNFADLIVLRSAKEASGKAATSSRQNMKSSGFGLTRPAWALAYGLPRAPTTSPRAKAPRWREGSSKQTAARGSTDLGSGDPPATTQTASVDPEGPVPSGALSITSERPIRRALGRKAASARFTSKKSKFRGSKRRQTDDFFHPSLHSERIQTDALGLAACDEARTAKVQKSFALPELTLCNGVPC